MMENFFKAIIGNILDKMFKNYCSALLGLWANYGRFLDIFKRDFRKEIKKQPCYKNNDLPGWCGKCDIVYKKELENVKKNNK